MSIIYVPWITFTSGILLEDKSGKYYTNYRTKKTTITRGPHQKSVWVVMRLKKKPHSSLYKKKTINTGYYGTFNINKS